MMSIAGVLLLCSWIAAAADEPAVKTPDKVVSETLRAEMGPIVDALLKEVPEEQKGNLPPGVKNFDEMKEFILKQFDPQILVSADEEKKFKLGVFDDAGNKARMDSYAKVFDQVKIDLPRPVIIFLAEHRKNELKGARLELAVRTSKMTVEKIKKALEKK